MLWKARAEATGYGLRATGTTGAAPCGRRRRCALFGAHLVQRIPAIRRTLRFARETRRWESCPARKNGDQSALFSCRTTTGKRNRSRPESRGQAHFSRNMACDALRSVQPTLVDAGKMSQSPGRERLRLSERAADTPAIRPSDMLEPFRPLFSNRPAGAPLRGGRRRGKIVPVKMRPRCRCPPRPHSACDALCEAITINQFCQSEPAVRPRRSGRRR